ncbi:MAG: hypothetical protein OEV46_11010, partial [Betaproteobacteria bacterium]|nr:hypothetical protein [Betaproteobacteria bacterium]
MSEANPPPPTPPAPPAPKRRRRRPGAIVAWGLGFSIAAALAVVAAYSWLRSQHALDAVLDAAVAHSGGRLAVAGARGSLTDRLDIARLAWTDAGTEVVAEDVVLRFSPVHLLHGEVKVVEATARRVVAKLPPPSDAPVLLPESIAPPLPLDVDRLAVATLEWRVGERSGTLAGASLAYTGNSRRHSVRDVRIATTGAKLAGEASVGARKPWPVDARFALDLAAP